MSGYDIQTKSLPIERLTLVQIRPRAHVMLELVEHCQRELHTVIEGSLRIEQLRVKGRFARGWRVSCRAIAHGQTFGLYPSLSVPYGTRYWNVIEANLR